MNLKRAMNVGFGLARLGFGVFATVNPERLGAGWIGAEEASRPRVKVILHALGVRDIALGAGTVWGAAGGSPRPWLAASVAADLGDMTATIMARDTLPKSGVQGTVVLTAAAATAGVVLIALDQKSKRPLS